MKVEIKNIDRVIEFMQSKNEALSKAIPESINESTIFIMNELKKDIMTMQWAKMTGDVGPSVDTGLFVGTIQIEPMGKNAARVFSDSPYAKWLEYGTSPRTSKTTGNQITMMSGPRLHFGRTRATKTSEAIKKFNEKIKTTVKL